jgi:hypothetical protein
MHAQISDRMTSRTRVDEYDTAESRGGQIGGRLMGFGYKLLAMRCVSGQVIVGANIRRGDVLDYLQIVCAVPSCQNGSCSWSSPQLGMSAGNPAGGDPHPGMMCPSNQILSGIRGRVVSFTVPVVNQRTGFDYAADLEIECSQMTGPPVVGRSGQKLHPVSQGGAWYQPDGGFENASPGVAANVIKNFITQPISCPGYGATTVSVGIANFLVLPDHPVVQAVSLFCPNIAPTQSATAGDFRVMVTGDPMWTQTNYAGTTGYFPGTGNAISNCHGFVGEMGINTPGANVCGNGFLMNVPQLPAGTPLQLGDVAVVYGRFAGKPYQYHSAIYIGCGYYLQRNGGSDIQISDQNFINNFTTNEQVFYVRPTGSLATYQAELAMLKQRLNPSEGPTAYYQHLISQIQSCFP